MTLQQARLFSELALTLWRISIHRNMIWLQSWGPALPTRLYLAGPLWALCTYALIPELSGWQRTPSQSGLDLGRWE